MDASENFFNDPKLWIVFASLVVSICSAIYSGRKASRALAISESQERRRQPQLGIYLAKAHRRVTPKRQLFGFLVSVANPTDINNAVARIAGVLAIAILGIVLVKSFSFDLNRSLAGRSVPPDTLQYVYANETKLAGVDLPSGLEPATAMLLRTSISRAFVFGFRIAMLICAGLSLASALVAWLMIPAKAG